RLDSLWTFLVVERAARHSRSPTGEWCAAFVRIFHDFRSENHTRLAHRSNPLRIPGGGGSGFRSIQAVPNKWTTLELGGHLAARACSRPIFPWPEVLMACAAMSNHLSATPSKTRERTHS